MKHRVFRPDSMHWCSSFLEWEGMTTQAREVNNYSHFVLASGSCSYMIVHVSIFAQ